MKTTKYVLLKSEIKPQSLQKKGHKDSQNRPWIIIDKSKKYCLKEGLTNIEVGHKKKCLGERPQKCIRDNAYVWILSHIRFLNLAIDNDHNRALLGCREGSQQAVENALYEPHRMPLRSHKYMP